MSARRAAPVLLLLLAGAAARAETLGDADVYARVESDRIVLGNEVVERSWTRAPFQTEALVDKRAGGWTWSTTSDDFELRLDAAAVPSSLFEATAVRLETLPLRGLRVTITLEPLGVSPGESAPLPPGFAIVRTVEAYPRIAGFRSETIVESPVTIPVSGYVLDRLAPAFVTSARMHSFRAGADWREPDWPGPPIAIGDAHAGTWRETTPAAAGESVTATAQWMSIAAGNGRTAFFVLERNDYASSEMSFDGRGGRALVDLSKDVLYIGPFEEEAHVENPGPGPSRHRIVRPGRRLRLEPVFTGFGVSDDDEAWQHYRYLESHRMPPYAREIVFNTNGVDDNRISTGAKDDVDFEEFERQLPIAKRLGVEMFVFDDGWQARSGDWCPDSPGCPEPRGLFPPRFPDASFAAVRSVLGDVRLGLWMSPMHFNPASEAWRRNPQWACLPVSLPLVAVNMAQPDDGSNEAGIGTWNPEALAADGTKLVEFVEGRIRKAITEWGVRYFKFDFLVWLDCAGIETVDAYSYRESFMAMLDRLIRDYPEVTFQMDETNDYRLFPFEAIARGPTWYQNGSPLPKEALHASWRLAPWVPPFALGRNALRNNLWDELSVDTLMAVALPSHFTFFNDLTAIPDAVVDRVRVWTDYYKAHRTELATFTYPLLDDPLSDGWTALQPWNPETGRGFLLVYRQGSPLESKTVALRNVPPNRRFRLYEAPDDAPLRVRTSKELSKGIPILIPTPNTARVIRVEAIE